MSSATRPRDRALSPDQLRQLAREWGLTPAEYDRIVAGLGRLPTVTELAMFSVEWCEHCGYPKSRNVLRLLPRDSRRVRLVVGADCGGCYLTDDLAVVFKVESHNHPSQVEPYQGAATGVGGIIRDIFTCGARPIATRTLSQVRVSFLSWLSARVRETRPEEISPLSTRVASRKTMPLRAKAL